MEQSSFDESQFVPVREDYFSVRPHPKDAPVYRFVVSEGSTVSHVRVAVEGLAQDFPDAPNAIECEFSFEKLSTLHQRLVELFPSQVMPDSLPELPRKPGGFWGYLSWTSVKVPEGLYQELAAYFENMVRICGPQIGLRLFFDEIIPSTCDYEEKWSELHRKYYCDERDRALHNYEQVVAAREERGFTSVNDLHDYYAEEDEAYFFLRKAHSVYYLYQTKPFEDLCEIARSRRNEAAQFGAECSDAERLAAAHEESEYHREYTASKEKLDEVLLERFKVEAEMAELRLSRTEEDRIGFGEHWDKRAWGRLEGLKDEANRAIVRYLEAKLEHLEGQREMALLAMAKVEEGPTMEQELADHEVAIYELQTKCLEVQLLLLKEEDTKLNFQLQYLDGEQRRSVEEKMKRLHKRGAKYRIKKKELETACKERHKDTLAAMTANMERSYAAHMAAERKETLMKKVEEEKKQEIKLSRLQAVQRVKQYKQGVQSKKDAPKGYVPPWKKVQERQAKDGSKSSPKPTESMTSSRMSSLSVHPSIRSRKTHAASTAAPAKRPEGRSRTEDSHVIQPDQALPLDQNTLLQLLQSMQLQVQQKSVSPFVATPPAPPSQLSPPQPPPPPPPAPPPPPPVSVPTTTRNPHPKTTEVKAETTKPSQTAVQVGISAEDITNIRSRLKKSNLGQSIRVSKQALSTDDEVKLIRSGGDPERLSLTDPHQAALKRRVAEVRMRVAPDPDDDHGDEGIARDNEEWS